jgi:hypothetical protein
MRRARLATGKSLKRVSAPDPAVRFVRTPAGRDSAVEPRHDVRWVRE